MMHDASGLLSIWRADVNRVEVVHSMRVGAFGEFVVLGSQYQDHQGEMHWYVAVIAGRCSHAKIHHVLRGKMPEGAGEDEREAMIEAIWLWESEPASKPN
jgi:hypothetical protein